MAGTSTIGGLVSGLDTATILEQLMAVSRKRIDIVAADQTDKSDKLGAYQSLNTQLLDFKSKADTLKDEDTFDVFKSAITTNSTNFEAKELLTVSTTTDASPGTHTIAFTSTSQLAKARRLSSASFSSKTTALNISGEFVINGKAIKVSTTDTLTNIATSINNANLGSNAIGVTATILSVSSANNRLVLTSDDTGKDQFVIFDASDNAENVLQSLGIAGSATTINNPTSDGAQSEKFTSSDNNIKSMLGLSTAQSNTVTIAGSAVAINLASDSLTTIASTINSITGVSASVSSTTTDNVTKYYIDISGTTSFTDNDNILETLGILEANLSGSNGAVSEVHESTVVNTSSGTAVTGATTFNLIDGASVGAADTITIQGTNSNGTSITTTTYSIYSGSYKTLNDLLTTIEGLYSTSVDAYFTSSGKIAIKDLTAGDSQLSLTLITNNEGGGTLDFGALSAATEGYTMETTAGQDAMVKIDGVTVTRSDNSIDDVITGVTVDLGRIESGSTVDLTILRDKDSIKSNINNFITAYNSAIEFINQEFTYNEDTEASGLLAGESTLSSIKRILQSTITNTYSLLDSDYDALTLIGIVSDKDGKLSLKDTDFTSAFNTDFNAVKRLFIAEGTATNREITYAAHTKDTVAGNYAISINTVATRATVTGTTNLASGIGAANTETLTITDSATGRVASITLQGGGNAASISAIVNTINSELDTEYTQKIVGDNAQTYGGGTAITGSTAFNSINGTSLVNGDVITFSGTTRTGQTISEYFNIVINSTTTSTVQDFLSAIETAYDNDVSATISSGKIALTDDSVGDSQLSITITEPDALNFGTVSTSNTGGVVGRYAMEITASYNGSNNLVITHDTYGSGQGFTISESPSSYTGLTAGGYSGINVVGTINGEAATGVGQILTGNAPASGSTTSIKGLVIIVNSTTTGSKGNVKLTKGVAETMYNNLIAITDSYDGILDIRMDGLKDNIDDLQEVIDDMEDRLVMERTILERKFVDLEVSLAKLNSVSSFLAQQIKSL